MSDKREAAAADPGKKPLDPNIDEYIEGEIKYLRKMGLAGDLDVMTERAMERLNRKHEEMRDVERELEVIEYDIKEANKNIDKWCRPERKILERLLVWLFKMKKPFDVYYDEFDELRKKKGILEARRDALLDEIDNETDLAKRADACRRALSR